MITITDNVATITAGGTKLVQEMHPETGRKFSSTAECFSWAVESGWFAHCQMEAIRLLKQQTTHQLEQLVPAFKQVNAALGIYSRSECRRIKNNIVTLRNELAKKEKAFLNAKTVEEFNRLLNLHDQTHFLFHPRKESEPTPPNIGFWSRIKQRFQK